MILSVRSIILLLCLLPVCTLSFIFQKQQRQYRRRQQQQQQQQQPKELPPMKTKNNQKMAIEKRNCHRNPEEVTTLSSAMDDDDASSTADVDSGNGIETNYANTFGRNTDHDYLDEERIARMIEKIPDTAKTIHLIVLVHGWLGNAMEMDSIRQCLDRRSSSNGNKLGKTHDDQHHHFMIYSTTVNEKRTHDGIAAGGQRLANEINFLLRHIGSKQQQDSDKENDNQNSNNRKKQKYDHTTTTTLSIVGNSLGGLYARYALGCIDLLSHNKQKFFTYQHNSSTTTSSNNVTVIPKLFITTATPHLGTNSNTFLKLPRIIEKPIALVMKQTGKDLFSFSSVLEQMTIEPKFVMPLLKFEHRIAYANVHGTDFQVPTATAAFWEDESDSEHFLCTSHDDDDDDDESKDTAFLLHDDSCIQNNNDKQHGVDDENNNDSIKNIEMIDDSERMETEEDSIPTTTRRRRSSWLTSTCHTASHTSLSSLGDNNSNNNNIVAVYKTMSDHGMFFDAIRNDEEISLSKCLDAMGWTKVLVDVRPILPSLSNKNNSDDDNEVDSGTENSISKNNTDSTAAATNDASSITLGCAGENVEGNPDATTINSDCHHGCGDDDDRRRGGDSSPSTVPDEKTKASSSSSLSTAKELLQKYGGGQFLTIPLGHTVMVANAKNGLYGWINQGGKPIMDSLASDVVDYLLLSTSSLGSDIDDGR